MKEMSLSCILIDWDEMRQLNNETTLVLQLLAQLEKKGYRILDIRGTDCYDSMHKKITNAGFDAEMCLMLTSCERTLSLINDLPIATVGIELPVKLCIEGTTTDGQEGMDTKRENLSKAQIIVQGFEEVDEDFLIRIWQRKHGIPWRIFETKRCYVREMTLDDLDALYEMYRGPGMTDYIEPLYENRQEEYEYERAYINNMYWFYGYGMWLVFEKDTDKLAGRAGLDNREINGEIELEMGYAIAAQYQRQGYAMEVCQMIMEYARQALDFPRLNCLIREENVPSIALICKLGFHRAGNAEGMLRYVYMFPD